LTLGYLFLLSAFVMTAYTLWAGISGLHLKRNSLIESARRAIYGQFFMVTFAVLTLAYLLLSRDFSYRYVAEYSDRQLPVLYTISALWAGQSGSLLFWTWLLTVFNALFVFVNRKREQNLQPYVFTITSAVTIFFLSLVVYSTNPFEKLPAVLPDGYGLNPLLQDIGMIFHPPTLFLGFVGFTIPFAFALAALMKGDKSSNWINQSRNWSLFAWIMLTIGNLLGAEWAYVELGWGGYWAWDPVENASLLPWLTGTAFIHSIMAQRSMGMMKIWNVSLAIATFLLTILGTFITRSGIISSVHAFGRSNIGTFFLVFMGIVLVSALSLILWRRNHFKSEKTIATFMSREFGFLFNNFILVILTVTIMWGTLYPAITELIIGKQITLGEQFFNKVSIPFGIILLLLLAICPLLLWGKAKLSSSKKSLYIIITSSVLFALILFAAGVRHGASLIVLGISFLAVAIIITRLIQSGLSRQKTNNESLMTAIGKILRLKTRQYAAYLIHIGVVMIYVAIVGTTAYKSHREITLPKGGETVIDKYRLVYVQVNEIKKQRKDILRAEVEVYQGDQKIGILTPEKYIYKSGLGEPKVTSEVSIRTNLIEDLYISMASFQSDGSATFVIMVNPLQIWLWIGGIVITIGVIIIFVDVYRKRRALPQRNSVQKKEGNK